MFLILVIILVLFIIGGVGRMYKSQLPFVKGLAWLLSLLIIAVGYLVYDAFYPNESFYIEEWKRGTGFQFPKNAKLIWKDATYPDQHNDYTSSVVFQVSSQDFNKIHNRIESNAIGQLNSNKENWNGFFKQILSKEYQDEKLVHSWYFLSKKDYLVKISFLKDYKTIIFQRHSS